MKHIVSKTDRLPMVTLSPQWVTVLLQFTVTIFGNRLIKCLIIWPAGLNKALSALISEVIGHKISMILIVTTILIHVLILINMHNLFFS